MHTVIGIFLLIVGLIVVAAVFSKIMLEVDNFFSNNLDLIID